MSNKPKIIAIVGPTASGKTSLSVKAAHAIGGEVISADSRQVYKGLDLGTGKVTHTEMEGISHHLLDIAEPNEIYTAAQFKTDATQAITLIQNKGHVPIIAGGTFFYLDTLLNKQQAAPVEPNEVFRATLEEFSNEKLFAQLQRLDSVRAATIDPHNRHRLVRALEIVDALGTVPPHIPSVSPYTCLTIGLELDKEQLRQNIHSRILSRLEDGMVEEVINLHKAGMSYERMHALGLEYRYIALYLQKELTLEEMIEQLSNKTRQFAKRQMTWLKRDASIEWFKPTDTERILKKVTEFLHAQ